MERRLWVFCCFWLTLGKVFLLFLAHRAYHWLCNQGSLWGHLCDGDQTQSAETISPVPDYLPSLCFFWFSVDRQNDWTTDHNLIRQSFPNSALLISSLSFPFLLQQCLPTVTKFLGFQSVLSIPFKIVSLKHTFQIS